MHDLNKIFIKICEKLNLSDTLYKKLEDRYKAVSNYLSNCPGCENLKIYPQGSIAIGTTIRPIGQEEYDLDFVCEKRNINPFELFELIKKYLKSNGHYKNIIEEKKRCVRINYKEDFHLDILPAQPSKNNPPQTDILIPDRELQKLFDSNPKGYVIWFERKCIAEYRTDKEIEVLPKYQKPLEKSNLQCIVQLIKKHRNIFFKSQPELSPASIIITTLCGEYYINQGSIFNDMVHIVKTIKKNAPTKIGNPVNSQELLSEKWEKNPILHKKFTEWIIALNTDLETLKNKENLKEKFERMFGEKIMSPIFDELEDRNLIHKNRNNLFISSTGVLSNNQSHISVPQNTFYGEEKN